MLDDGSAVVNAALNICTAPLSYSFPKEEWPHFVGVAFGICGCYGWGLAAESLITRSGKSTFSWAHAFVQGTVVTVIVMALASLSGFCRPSHAVAGAGLMVGAGTLLKKWQAINIWRERITAKRRRSQPSGASGLRSLWHGGLSLAVVCCCLLWGFFLVGRPSPYGDLTAIWAYHGKVLSCECWATSHFVQELYWTGTHPEYPLFLPFMHAYFFSLMDSFRDDIVNVWRAWSLVCVGFLIFKTMLRTFGSALAAVYAALVFLTMLLLQPFSPVAGMAAELESALFVALVTLVLWSGDHRRLWLYLLALAFTKREAAMGAVFLMGMVGLTMGLGVLFKAPREGRWPRLKPYVLPLIPVLVLSALMKLLPSHHEEYEKHLFDLKSWQKGLTQIQVIIDGCLGLIRSSPFWKELMQSALPIALAYAVGSLLWDRSPRSQRVAAAVLWTPLMMLVFLGVYIVSPWGSGLYAITFLRLMQPLAVPIIFGSAAGVALLLNRRSILFGAVGIGVMVPMYFLMKGTTRDQANALVNAFKQRASAHQTGIAAFAQYDKERELALALDKTLPPAAAGALLDDTGYFIINYLLYPRRFYANVPDQVAGTATPWTAWSHVSQSDMAKYGFKFVVKDWQKVSPP